MGLYLIYYNQELNYFNIYLYKRYRNEDLLVCTLNEFYELLVLIIYISDSLIPSNSTWLTDNFLCLDRNKSLRKNKKVNHKFKTLLTNVLVHLLYILNHTTYISEDIAYKEINEFKERERKRRYH